MLFVVSQNLTIHSYFLLGITNQNDKPIGCSRSFKRFVLVMCDSRWSCTKGEDGFINDFYKAPLPP